MSKYGYLHEVLIRRGLLERGRYLAPAEIPRGSLELAHDRDYVERVIECHLTEKEVRRIGLPGSPKVVRRTRLAAAGTTLAGWLALEHGIACNSAGGSHHAAAGYGAGFCVFNDVAVAIHTLRAQGAVGSCLVIDADVHQGDGTARIFEQDPGAFTFSIHAEKNFPVRKAQSDLDIGLPDGVRDEAYLEALKQGLQRALGAGHFDLAFYNAGVDVHHDDDLGRLSLSETGIRARDHLVISQISALGIPLVGVLGGGYSVDPEALAARHAILFEEAAALSA